MAAAVEWGGDSGEDKKIEGSEEGPDPRESERTGKQACSRKVDEARAASIDI